MEDAVKHREPFSLHSSKMKYGKVFYYRVCDTDGARTSRRSTGHTNRTLARNRAIELIRNGEEVTQKELTFAAFARKWWLIFRSDNLAESIGKPFTDEWYGYQGGILPSPRGNV